MPTIEQGRQALARLEAAPAHVTELRKEVEEALHGAQTFNDPDFTADAILKRRQEKLVEARATYFSVIRTVDEQYATDYTIVREWANESRPVANDPAALMRQQFAWDRVRMLTEGGQDLPTILVNANVETALAIREWGPTWLEAQSPKHASFGERWAGEIKPYDAGWLLRAVDDRLIQIEGGKVAEALQAARAADAVVAKITPFLNYLKSVVTGSAVGTPGLAAAIQAHYDSRHALRGLDAMLTEESAQ